MLLVIPQYKIPVYDWSKPCHATFTNMSYSHQKQTKNNDNDKEIETVENST